MIQEYIALTIFSLAVLYSGYQLLRLIIPGSNKEFIGCGSGNCGCSHEKKPVVSKNSLITTDLMS
jgi:hypothetical protein